MPDNRFLVLGHRGVPRLERENSLASFKRAQKLNLDGVELDVRLSKDGKLVISHDSEIGGKEIEKTAFSELGGGITTLEEVFENCPDLFFDIEVKTTSPFTKKISKRLWSTIAGFHMEKRCIVSSFNPLVLRSFKRCSHKRVPTALIWMDEDIPRLLWGGRLYRFARADLLKPHYKALTGQVKKRGLPVIVWTVDENVELYKEAGVKGIISNRAEELKKL